MPIRGCTIQICLSALGQRIRKHQFLLFGNAILLCVMGAYVDFIRKAAKNNDRNLCTSNKSLALYKKYHFYYQFILYTFLASTVLNMLYLSFYTMIPKSAITTTLFYGPLFAMAVVCLGFALDGFLKLRSLKDEPADCQKMFDNFKAFFIIGLTMSALQIFLSFWIVVSGFIR